MNIRQALVAAALLAASAATARADVIVVDPQGGPGEVLLKAAMDSAQAGDILLLKAGDYSSGLDSSISAYTPQFAIVADTGTEPVLRGLHLLAGRVLLRGIDIHAPAGQPSTGSGHGMLYVNGGSAWVEDCDLHGRDGFGTFADHNLATVATGLEWTQYGEAVFTHCRLEGGHGGNDLPGGSSDAGSGYDAISAKGNWRVTVADCTVLGGKAGDGLGMGAVHGGHALEITQHEPHELSIVWITDSQLTGGDDGADGWAFGTPGSGIYALVGNPQNRIYVRDSVIQAGQVVGAGVAVPDIDVPAGVLQVLPASARSCSMPAPLRSGESAKLTIQGKPGDLVLLVVSDDFDFKMKPVLQGAINFEPSASYPVPPLSIVDASGVLDVPFRLPPLPADFGGGQVLYMQGVFYGSDGKTLGAPTSLVWLDAGI